MPVLSPLGALLSDDRKGLLEEEELPGPGPGPGPGPLLSYMLLYSLICPEGLLLGLHQVAVQYKIHSIHEKSV